MFNGIKYLVIAVNDLESASARYSAIFGIPVSRNQETAGAGYKSAIFEFPDATRVELIQPTDETGVVARRVKAAGEGPYMLSMKVDSLSDTVADLRPKGLRLLGDPGEGNPVTGQVFIHPASANGMLITLTDR